MLLKSYITEKRIFEFGIGLFFSLIFIISVFMPDFLWPEKSILTKIAITFAILIIGTLIIMILSKALEYIVNLVRHSIGQKTYKEMDSEIETEILKINAMKMSPERIMQRIERNSIVIILLLIILIGYLLLKEIDMTSIRMQVRQSILKLINL